MAANLKVDSVTIDARRLTGRDLRDMGRVLEMPLTAELMGNLSKNPPMEVVYAMLWVTLRRDDPAVTFDDVLDIAIGDLPTFEATGPKALSPGGDVAAT